jgi:hypothetical protein
MTEEEKEQIRYRQKSKKKFREIAKEQEDVLKALE